MNIHKILCYFNHHNWEYWNDKKYSKYDIIQRMRKCTICKKKERHMLFGSHDIWLKPYPKPKSLNQVRKEQKL